MLTCIIAYRDYRQLWGAMYGSPIYQVWPPWNLDYDSETRRTHWQNPSTSPQSCMVLSSKVMPLTLAGFRKRRLPAFSYLALGTGRSKRYHMYGYYLHMQVPVRGYCVVGARNT